MDTLERLLTAAAPLLHRVDDVLATAGAPPHHRVWAELRRVHLLPGDAARAVAALRPSELLEAVPELRADARAYGVLASSLPEPGEWTGAAAEAYGEARQRTADHLSGGAESLDERLEASADLAEALIDWMRGAREALAGVLAEVLTSAETVRLEQVPTGLPTPEEVSAAAEVAASVLQTVAESYELGADLLHATKDLADELTTVH